MYVESCTIFVVFWLNRDPSWGLYTLKYDSATACGLLLYLCSYKLNGSITAWLRLVVTQAVREQQVTVGIARLTFEGATRGSIQWTGRWLGWVRSVRRGTPFKHKGSISLGAYKYMVTGLGSLSWLFLLRIHPSEPSHSSLTHLA